MTTREPPKPAARLEAGAELEIAFTDLLANGQAVGRAGGVVVFCFGPLPEERALVRIASVKPKYAVGEMLELLQGSPHRVAPFCPVFGACGGCQVQHLSYPAQLVWKRDVVRNALARIGGFVDANVRDAIGMTNPRAYRNKMSLVLDHTSSTPTIGFYQQRSHDVVPIESCPIVTPPLDAFIGRLNLARLDAAAKPALAQTRHVVARSAQSTGQSVVTLTTERPSEAARKAAPALLAMLPGAVGISNSYDLNSANAIMGREHRTLIGESEIEETLGGVRYRVSGGSFFQVNVDIVQRILSFVQHGLGEPRAIVDLYCGAGTFSLFFAKHGSTVLGIEENGQAIAEAQANAELNGLQAQASFRTGKVEEIVRTPAAARALAAADIVFLDPPRKGSDERTLGAVADAGVPNVWYLSCDPATLARDLKFLASKGYRLGIVQPFDMFPQTGHVETLVTLHRVDAAPAGSGEASQSIEKESEYPDVVIRKN